jgi:hypothetical protein
MAQKGLYDPGASDDRCPVVSYTGEIDTGALGIGCHYNTALMFGLG